MSSTPRNSYHSAANPPPVLAVEDGPSFHPSSGHHSSSRSGSRTSSSHGSSRSVKQSSTKPSKNPFSRLVAAGDMPSEADRWSKSGPASLHRSNATASHGSSNYASSHKSSRHSSSHCDSRESSSHRSSDATIRGPSSRAESRPSSKFDSRQSSSRTESAVGMTRSNSTSAVSYSTKKYSSSSMSPESGALVPMQRSNTVSTRSSSTRGELIPAGAYGPLGTSSTSQQPHHTSNRMGHTTINVTNINIGCGNTSSENPLAGFSRLEIGGGGSSGRSKPSRRYGNDYAYPCNCDHGSGRCDGSCGRIVEVDDETAKRMDTARLYEAQTLRHEMENADRFAPRSRGFK